MRNVFDQALQIFGISSRCQDLNWKLNYVNSVESFCQSFEEKDNLDNCQNWTNKAANKSLFVIVVKSVKK